MGPKSQSPLTEAQMKRAESRITPLALKATRQAAQQARKTVAQTGMTLVQAQGNQLVQISASGAAKVLKTLPAGIPVIKGLRLSRPKP